LMYHLGVVQKALGKNKEARANLEKALSQSPNFPGSVDAKAQLSGLPK
jgi:TolA-binding protein